jgi:hypothetical protein
MNATLVNFFERRGLKMNWHCRKSFMMWLLAPIFAAVTLISALLLLNPQSCRIVYIFQSVFTKSCDQDMEPSAGYTGTWRTWYLDGTLTSEGHYKDGKLDGDFTGWDDHGRKWLATAYQAGQCNGDYLVLYPGGTTNKMYHFSDGEPVGYWYQFYSSGAKCEERYFSAPGVADGEELAWNTNGALLFHRSWRNGDPWDGDFMFLTRTNRLLETFSAGTLVYSTNILLSVQ